MEPPQSAAAASDNSRHNNEFLQPNSNLKSNCHQYLKLRSECREKFVFCFFILFYLILRNGMKTGLTDWLTEWLTGIIFQSRPSSTPIYTCIASITCNDITLDFLHNSTHQIPNPGEKYSTKRPKTSEITKIGEWKNTEQMFMVDRDGGRKKVVVAMVVMMVVVVETELYDHMCVCMCTFY